MTGNVNQEKFLSPNIIIRNFKENIKLCIIISILLYHFPFKSQASSENKILNWKVGVAKVNITPEQSMWMDGYASRDHPSEGKRVDLWAKAMAVEDAKGNRSVFVSIDIVGLEKKLSDKIRERLEKEYKLSKAQIILNSSHTHTGPVTYSGIYLMWDLDSNELNKIDFYVARLENNLVSLVGEALKSMQPAKIYSGNGVTRFQVNRRNNREANLQFQNELKGPNDFAVPVIKAVGKNNTVIAVLFGYACHNTVLGDYKWSGDYAGFAQIELEKLYPGSIALFYQGAGADQNPLPRRTPELAIQYGKELAAAVERVISENNMKPLTSQLVVSYSEIDLQFKKAPPTKEELKKIIDGTSEIQYPEYLKQSARALVKILESGSAIMSSYPYPVQVWKLGGQAIFSFGGELTVGYSLELKRIFGRDIFVFGYSNDVMAYIPTATILEEGGYEGTCSPVFTTPWASDIESKIIDTVVMMAKGLGVEELGDK